MSQNPSTPKDRQLIVAGVLILIGVITDFAVIGSGAFGVLLASALLGGIIFAFSAISGVQGGGCFMALALLGAIGMCNKAESLTTAQGAIVATMLLFSTAGYVLGGIGHRTSGIAEQVAPRFCPHCKESVKYGATRCPHCTSVL